MTEAQSVAMVSVEASNSVNQGVADGLGPVSVLEFVMTIIASMEFVWSVRPNTSVKMIGFAFGTHDIGYPPA